MTALVLKLTIVFGNFFAFKKYSSTGYVVFINFIVLNFLTYHIFLLDGESKLDFYFYIYFLQIL